MPPNGGAFPGDPRNRTQDPRLQDNRPQDPRLQDTRPQDPRLQKLPPKPPVASDPRKRHASQSPAGVEKPQQKKQLAPPSHLAPSSLSKLGGNVLNSSAGGSSTANGKPQLARPSHLDTAVTNKSAAPNGDTSSGASTPQAPVAPMTSNSSDGVQPESFFDLMDAYNDIVLELSKASIRTRHLTEVAQKAHREYDCMAKHFSQFPATKDTHVKATTAADTKLKAESDNLARYKKEQKEIFPKLMSAFHQMSMSTTPSAPTPTSVESADTKQLLTEQKNMANTLKQLRDSQAKVDAKFTAMASRLEKQEAEMKKQEAEMKKQEAELKKQEAELKKQGAEMKKQEAELQKQQAELKEKDTKLRAIETRVGEQEVQLTQKDAKLSTMQSQIADLNSRLGALQSDLKSALNQFQTSCKELQSNIHSASENIRQIQDNDAQKQVSIGNQIDERMVQAGSQIEERLKQADTQISDKLNEMHLWVSEQVKTAQGGVGNGNDVQNLNAQTVKEYQAQVEKLAESVEKLESQAATAAATAAGDAGITDDNPLGLAQFQPILPPGPEPTEDELPRVDRMESEILALQHIVSGHTQQYNNLTTDYVVQAMVDQMSTMYPAAKDFQTTVNTINGRMHNLSGSLSALSNRINGLDGDQGLRTALDDAVSRGQKEFQTLSAAIKEVQGNVAELEGSLKTALNEVARIDPRG